MREVVTAILHLHQPALPWEQDAARRSLAGADGVLAVRFVPRDLLLVVRFDHRVVGVAEIVRRAKRAGVTVAGVAQRRERVPIRRVLSARRHLPARFVAGATAISRTRRQRRL
ncbi:MAG: hypothetical protein HKO59_18060 [Phycisphaerales bacterium]|nr:hypothetical protein [Phycisphaerae bacterium]NNF44274.1 hypothetical protein [Phycisphaerales bacterium]NNM27843.1 hypothetical protein [Phycisphaerales bacterium]